MKPSFTFVLGAALAFATALPAQRAPGVKQPSLGFVYPAGGCAGTSFEVAVGGQNLEGVTGAVFLARGISAEVVDFQRPLTQKEWQQVREEMQKLQQKRRASAQTEGDSAVKWTDEDASRMKALREKMAYRPNRKGTPAIAETVQLRVTIPPDTPPGNTELRLQTATGTSNPLVFVVGQLPEITAPVEIASRTPPPGWKPGQPAGPPTDITIPAVVNGQILPGEVDHYRFEARAGQLIVVSAAARALVPYLADAVPGWFQATLALIGEDGREIAYDDDYRFNPDPTLAYRVPRDGTYTVEIKDAIFRGRQDFVYRITIGEVPFITDIYPLGGPAGAPVELSLQGWNLPVARARLEPLPDIDHDTIFNLTIHHGGLVSNPVPVERSLDSGVFEVAPENPSDAPQAVSLPVVIDGRIETPGDIDVFSFSGSAGMKIVAEVDARRLNSPLDSLVWITDENGARLAANDDHEDRSFGLVTHHADSYLMAELPHDGTWFIHIADTQNQGGAAYAYRLHLREPRPDFRLRLVPSAVTVRGGQVVPVTVHALRRDGFEGEIRLELDDPTRLFDLDGARIPAGQDSIRLTLQAPPVQKQGTVRLGISGTALIGGQRVTHPAVPSEDRMQAFLWRFLVPTHSFTANVLPGRFQTRGPRGTSERMPLKLTPGKTARLQFAAPIWRGIEKVEVELDDAPEGFTVVSTSASPGTVEVRLACDAEMVKAGSEGNLILTVFGERQPKNQAGKKRPPQRFQVATLPAVPFVVKSD